MSENKNKILLIEDDEFCAFTIIRTLKNDYEIVHKFNGADGIAEAKAEKYNLILMDIGLKDSSGVDILKTIREIEHYKNSQIIAVTAFAMLGDRVRFLESGFSGYLSKPFTISDLIDTVQGAFEKSVSSDAN